MICRAERVARADAVAAHTNAVVRATSTRAGASSRRCRDIEAAMVPATGRQQAAHDRSAAPEGQVGDGAR